MNSSQQKDLIPQGVVDLASQRVGGKALVANDEFFAPKENLLKPGRGIFIPDKYTARGKWMDGWESRRRRTPGNDWCVIKLGMRGIIRMVDIDTNHFLGNHPPFASVDAIDASKAITWSFSAAEKLSWTPLLTKSPLNPGSQNCYEIHSDRPWTHLRLNIFPDGGVARFRAFGDVVSDFSRYKPQHLLDLVSIKNGGVALTCSDMFFSSMNNLIMPGRAKNMGDGWETKRRRGPGYDWIILKLGAAGAIKKIELDTNHYKGNYPETCSIDTCNTPDATVEMLTAPAMPWKEILPKAKLQAHKRHLFEKELRDVGTATHLRLNIYPDGGVSRLRVYGVLER